VDKEIFNYLLCAGVIGAVGFFIRSIAKSSADGDIALKNDLIGKLNAAVASLEEKINRIDKSRGEDREELAGDVRSLEDMDEKRRMDVARLYDKDLWTKIAVAIIGTASFLSTIFIILWMNKWQ